MMRDRLIILGILSLAPGACGSNTSLGTAEAGVAADAIPGAEVADRPSDLGGPADADAAADVASPPPADALVAEDAASTFPARLYDGIWLVGWSGGLVHVSWVRFTPAADGLSGTWATAPGVCGACVGYFRGGMPAFDGCTASDGTFTVTPPATVTLRPPSACPEALMQSWTFADFRPGSNASRPEVIEEATVHAAVPTISGLQAEKFRANHCGADLTTCPRAYRF